MFYNVTADLIIIITIIIIHPFVICFIPAKTEDRVLNSFVIIMLLLKMKNSSTANSLHWQN